MPFAPRCCQEACLHLNKPSPDHRKDDPISSPGMSSLDCPQIGLYQFHWSDLWGGRACTACLPELATSWGQVTCHFSWRALILPAAIILGCSGNTGAGWGEGTEFSVVLLRDPILYHTAPSPYFLSSTLSCSPWPYHPFDVLRVPRSPGEVSSLSSESALLECLTHGGCPITLSGGWLECSRPWQAAPERTPRGVGKTRSSRFSAVTERSCFRAAKENFHTISILVGAINHLTRASQHCTGHHGRCNAFRQLLILTSLWAIHLAEKGVFPSASPHLSHPLPHHLSPSQTWAYLAHLHSPVPCTVHRSDEG